MYSEIEVIYFTLSSNKSDLFTFRLIFYLVFVNLLLQIFPIHI